MDNLNKIDRFDLLTRFLAGEASAEEAMVVYEWTNDPINKNEYEELLKVWNLSGNNKIPAPPSMSIAWSAIQTSIRQQTQPKTKLHRVLLMRSIAAAVLIGLIVLSFFVFRQKRSTTHPAAQNHNELITENAIATKNIHLKDGSAIALYKNSSIKYAGSFNDTDRSIKLSGEAYFDVAHDHSKPFTITIADLLIKVVGTALNVRSVDSNHLIEVQVQSGVVKMIAATKEITVTREQTGIYDLQNKELSKKDGIDINSLSYATKSFVFDDMPLTRVCRYLEKCFDIRIELDEKKFSDCRISTQFDNQSLDYILNIIATTVDATYRKKENHIYLEGDGCK